MYEDRDRRVRCAIRLKGGSEILSRIDSKTLLVWSADGQADR